MSLIISGVIDGPLSGGVPKVIELYVLEDIPDLSIYGIGVANDGGGSDGEEFTLSGIALAGEHIYISVDTFGDGGGFADFFGFEPNFTTDLGALSINGDDAVELFLNGTVIDTFGDPLTDGTGQPWEYVDGWAYRNTNSGPDGASFNVNNWSFSGPNALDGEVTNDTAFTPFPIGSFETEPLASYFETVDHGWTVSGATLTRNQEVKSGNILLRAEDAATDVYRFIAPDKFHGDKSTYEGGSISFKMQIWDRSGNTTPSFISNSDDVILTGAGMTIVAQKSGIPSIFGSDGVVFSEFTVDLVASNWRLGSATGPAVSDADFRAVLSDITDFRIRGEHIVGTDVTHLDDVVWRKLEQPLAEASVISNFDDSTEGWGLTGDGSDLVFSYEFGSGAGRDGAIRATDLASGPLWYFSAPEKFLGTKTGYLGGTLSWDSRGSAAPDGFPDPLVEIVGADATIVLTGPEPGTGWTSYSVNLSEGAWRLGDINGPLATNADIETALSNIQALRIRGEFVSGVDKGFLDNVEMIAPDGNFRVYESFNGGLLSSHATLDEAIAAGVTTGTIAMEVPFSNRDGDRIEIDSARMAIILSDQSFLRIAFTGDAGGVRFFTARGDRLEEHGVDVLGDTDERNVMFVGSLTGDSTLTGGLAADILGGTKGDDLISGDAGEDLLNGDGGADTIFGGDGNDTIAGDGGTDFVAAGSALVPTDVDSLFGGAGDDAFVYSRLHVFDHVDGGADVDTIDYSGFSSDRPAIMVNLATGAQALDGIAIGSVTGIENLIGANGANDFTGNDMANTLTGNGAADVLSGAGGHDLLIGAGDIDSLFGGAGDDTVNAGSGDDVVDGGAGANILRGQGGNDTMTGGDDAEEINGGTGDDMIDAGLGDDLIRGQGDADTIFGGGGADSIAGGAGADDIEGGTENDIIIGQGDSDTIRGQAGNDSLAGGSGNDELFGGPAADILRGQGNNDILHGDGGADTLFGAAGQDSLFGGAGDDRLFGGNSGDFLDGGTGDDLLNAGAQVDRFFFDLGHDSDTIAGFGDDQDIIQLTAALVGGAATGQEVVDSFAVQSGASVEFDFGGGDMIRVTNITLAQIADDIEIV